jgi:hypothetical protein
VFQKQTQDNQAQILKYGNLVTQKNSADFITGALQILA